MQKNRLTILIDVNVQINRETNEIDIYISDYIHKILYSEIINEVNHRISENTNILYYQKRCFLNKKKNIIISRPIKLRLDLNILKKFEMNIYLYNCKIIYHHIMKIMKMQVLTKTKSPNYENALKYYEKYIDGNYDIYGPSITLYNFIKIYRG